MMPNLEQDGDYPAHKYNFITVTSYIRHGVWNQQQLDCLLINLLRMTTTKTLKLRYTSHLWAYTVDLTL